MYPEHLQNWLDFGHGLLIFLLFRITFTCETGQIGGFQAFPGKFMEGMAWNFVCWCILTTFKSDNILVMVCWFSSFWYHFDLVKQVKFSVSRYFPENAWREWLEILHADVSWAPSRLIRYWSCSVDLPLLIWLGETGNIWCLQPLSGEHLGVNVEGGGHISNALRRVLSSFS